MTSRRGFLASASGVALGALPLRPVPPPHDHGAPGGERPDVGGENGPRFRSGTSVDHVANGFDPAQTLRDFDYGRVTVGSDGRMVRDWEIVAEDREIEVAPGVRFPAWTFNGRIPGPTLRCTQGDVLRVRFVYGSAHPHTMHFHGIHPAEMDGVPMVGRGIISPGEEFTYTFTAEPFGLHLYHCHVGPLAEHIARGMYGTFIVDPPGGRPPADELALGAALVVEFAVHNTTEGLAIVAPLVGHRSSLWRLGGLGLIAGAPAIVGALVGASVDNAALAALLFGVGVGAIAQVLVQLVPSLRDPVTRRHLDPAVSGGLIGGLVVMYLTGLLVVA